MLCCCCCLNLASRSWRVYGFRVMCVLIVPKSWLTVGVHFILYHIVSNIHQRVCTFIVLPFSSTTLCRRCFSSSLVYFVDWMQVTGQSIIAHNNLYRHFAIKAKTKWKRRPRARERESEWKSIKTILIGIALWNVFEPAYRFDIIFNNKSKRLVFSVHSFFRYRARCRAVGLGFYNQKAKGEEKQRTKNPFHYDWVFSFPFRCWYNDSLLFKIASILLVFYLSFFSLSFSFLALLFRFLASSSSSLGHRRRTHMQSACFYCPIQLVEILLWSFNIIVDRWTGIKFHTFTRWISPSLDSPATAAAAAAEYISHFDHIDKSKSMSILYNVYFVMYGVLCCTVLCIYLFLFSRVNKTKICLLLLLSCSVSSFYPFSSLSTDFFPLLSFFSAWVTVWTNGVVATPLLSPSSAMYNSPIFLRLHLESVFRILGRTQSMWSNVICWISNILCVTYVCPLYSYANAKITAVDRNNLIFHCGHWFTIFIDVHINIEICSWMHVHTTLQP